MKQAKRAKRTIEVTSIGIYRKGRTLGWLYMSRGRFYDPKKRRVRKRPLLDAFAIASPDERRIFEIDTKWYLWQNRKPIQGPFGNVEEASLAAGVKPVPMREARLPMPPRSKSKSSAEAIEEMVKILRDIRDWLYATRVGNIR